MFVFGCSNGQTDLNQLKKMNGSNPTIISCNGTNCMNQRKNCMWPPGTKHVPAIYVMTSSSIHSFLSPIVILFFIEPEKVPKSYRKHWGRQLRLMKKYQTLMSSMQFFKKARKESL